MKPQQVEPQGGNGPREARALDREIAERIMGATWAPYTSSMEALRPPDAHGKPCTMYPLYASRSTLTGEILEVWPECPAYSSSIEAAWEVVETMAGPGHRVDITANGSGDYYVLWLVMDEEGPGGWSTIAEIEADTAPLAICLAALASMREDPKP